MIARLLCVMIILATASAALASDRFLETEDGILDTDTGLLWWTGPDSNTPFQSAIDTVSELGEDWRMPDVEELRGLYESGITTDDWGLFQNNGSRVWCTVENDEEEGRSWYFYFDRGSEDWRLGDMSVNARVFAVYIGEEVPRD